MTLMREAKLRTYLAWHVLRGKPLLYKARINGGIEMSPGTCLAEVQIVGEGKSTTITLEKRR